MIKSILGYCVIGTFLINLCGLFPHVVSGNTKAAIPAGDVPSDISQKEENDKEGACCEKKVIETNAAVDIKLEGSLPQLPGIFLLDQDGNKVSIGDILKGKITVMNFIYTSCKSVCQILTNNFRLLEKSLDSIDKNGDVQLVSISIDPDVDTPERLREYASKQRIDLSRWTLLVSGLRSVERLSRALGFSNIDKSTHAPGVIIWDEIDKKWQRFAGITPPNIVLKQLNKLPAISG